MHQTITVEIPKDWMNGLPQEDLAFRHIIRMGIHQYKIERAIALYRENIGSPGYIAERLGLSKAEFINALRLNSIEPDFSEETVLEELAG